MAITLDSFMHALGVSESSGNYNSTNPDSGAHGKYQIMPENWPVWAAEAGIPGAPQTPANQELVTRFKLTQYFNQTKNWADVAAIWYSGQPLNPATKDKPQYSGGNRYPSIQEYVNTVVGRAGGSAPDFVGNALGGVNGRHSLWGDGATPERSGATPLSSPSSTYYTTKYHDLLKAKHEYEGLLQAAVDTPHEVGGTFRQTIINDLKSKLADIDAQIEDIIDLVQIEGQINLEMGLDQQRIELEKWRTDLEAGRLDLDSRRLDADIDQGQQALDLRRLEADIAAGRLTLDEAIAKVNEQLGKQEEARQRAEFVEDRLSEARAWAPAEPGKTSYSGSDVSDAHGSMLAQRGIDPGASIVNYSGTEIVDPARLLAEYDQQMGVGPTYDDGLKRDSDGTYWHGEEEETLLDATPQASTPTPAPAAPSTPPPSANPPAPPATGTGTAPVAPIAAPPPPAPESLLPDTSDINARDPRRPVLPQPTLPMVTGEPGSSQQGSGSLLDALLSMPIVQRNIDPKTGLPYGTPVPGSLFSNPPMFY